MKKTALILVFTLVFLLAAGTFSALLAEDGEASSEFIETVGAVEEKDDPVSAKAIAAAAVVAVVAAAGAVGMAVAISKSVGAISRQPEAAGKINSSMMLGLVFIETAIIYALIVAILIIFVL